jgi:hypothetical protein
MEIEGGVRTFFTPSIEDKAFIVLLRPSINSAESLDHRHGWHHPNICFVLDIGE